MAWPTSPTNGQRWTEYGRTWIYDGSGWGILISPIAGVSTLPVRLLAELVSPATDINRQFRVTDAPGGESVVYCDGTSYLRVSDQSPVK